MRIRLAPINKPTANGNIYGADAFANLTNDQYAVQYRAQGNKVVGKISDIRVEDGYATGVLDVTDQDTFNDLVGVPVCVVPRGSGNIGDNGMVNDYTLYGFDLIAKP